MKYQFKIIALLLLAFVLTACGGAITGTEAYCDDLEGQSVVIADDIADGGYTFIKLAEKLKEKGAGKIFLYVSHGIFSKGLDVLLDAGIDCVYTTDSFCDRTSTDKLKIISTLDPKKTLGWVKAKGIKGKLNLKNLFGLPAAAHKVRYRYRAVRIRAKGCH